VSDARGRWRISGLATLLACCVAVGALVGGTAFGAGHGHSRPSASVLRPLTDHSLPARIGAPARVLQMVTVTSDLWHSKTGVLRAWQRPSGGAWSPVHGPVSIVLGYNGWVIADRRIQSTGTTPAGRFGLPSAFGLLADPGTAMRYRQVDDSDWWPYEPRDPVTYNIYEYHRDRNSHWRVGYAEHLADYATQYAYAIVVGFNLPQGVHYSAKRNQRVATVHADTRRGGGIFLHVRGSGYTAGCVAMDQADVEWLLKWLDPDQHPQVVMGPYDYVLTL
jgi:L,D-peptidoglycan transpeptidase YkuD (ErfK/YbiS/YcfS/YnhG family)